MPLPLSPGPTSEVTSPSRPLGRIEADGQPPGCCNVHGKALVILISSPRSSTCMATREAPIAYFVDQSHCAPPRGADMTGLHYHGKWGTTVVAAADVVQRCPALVPHRRRYQASIPTTRVTPALRFAFHGPRPVCRDRNLPTTLLDFPEQLRHCSSTLAR